MYMEEIKKEKKFSQRNHSVSYLWHHLKKQAFLVFPRVGCPALPSSKTYQSIYQSQEFLASNKDQVNIYLGQGPFIYPGL